MLSLPLEPTDDRANPEFKNPATCAKWLGQLQFTNLTQTHATLRAQLEEFNRYPIRGLDRLQTLEALRETVHYVQADYAKKLAGKPLPLLEAEQGILAALTGLWQGMVTGYQRCLQAYHAGDKQLVPYGSLLCHRSLMYTGQQMFEFLRVGTEFEGALWQQLHAYYRFAEERGLLPAEVLDELNEKGHSTSCRTLYIKILLICHAHPHELTRAQQQQLERWLSQWGAGLTVDRSYAVSRGDAPPLAIDLGGTKGLHPVQREFLGNENYRFVAMVPMSKLLRVKTILLQQGQTPQQLELGNGLNNAECIDFLHHLHKYWCEPEGVAENGNVGLEAEVCFGLDAIYSYIANKMFGQPKNSGDDASRKQDATPSRAPTEKSGGAALGHPLENWRMADANILGARLSRDTLAGERLGANHIVATRAAADSPFMAGVADWVRATRDGKLHAGIRYFPGTPQAVVVEIPASKPAAGLLLPAMPEMSIPASLVLPRNLFQLDRKLTLVLPSAEKINVKLGFSVEKGVDYERVSFSKI